MTASPTTGGGRAGFPGRRIVTVAFLAQGLSTGATVYVYGVFLKPLAEEFGASRMLAGLGLSMLYAVQALASPSLGRALDRHSIRSIMLWGTGALSGGLVLLAAATSLWQIGLVFSLVVGLGAAMVGPLAAATLVANWFVRARGRALGVAALGTSVCGLLLPPVTSWVVVERGWREACVALGICVGIVLLPAIGGWGVSRPEERGFAPDGETRDRATGSGSEAVQPVAWTTLTLLRQRNFWAIAAGIGPLAAAIVALFTHLVAYATDHGIEPERASLLMSVVAGFGMLGKILFGAIIDRLDGRRAFWLMVAVQALGWLILLRDPSYASLLVSAAILGVGAGGNLPVSGALTGAAFGRGAFGRATGLMSPFILALTVLSPPLAGHLFDRTGSYDAVFQILLATTLLAALPAAFLRLPTAMRTP